MGADLSTARLQRLTEMGFSVAESRIALEATGGDVDRAAILLTRRRREREQAAGGALAYRINEFLREQRPWQEFFERFLWPEHMRERVQTNLLYYRGNYAIICGGCTVLGVLAQPSLLVVAGLVAATFYGAIEWGDEVVPVLNQRLALEQRATAAALMSCVLVNYSGFAPKVFRIVILCAGLVLSHAAFRARSLQARWAFFKNEVEKTD